MRPVRDRRGVAATEFALVAPVLAGLVLVTVDIVQYLRAQLRVEAAALQVAQVASQCNRITTADIDQFRRHAQRIIGNLATLTGQGGGFVLSAVYNQGGANKVAWQQRTGDAAFSSGVGAAGGTASVGGGFTVPNSQTMLAVELFATIPPGLSPMRLAQSVFAWDLRSRVQFLSRAPDATRLQQPPTSSGSRECTA
jgi:Flp pilus assembly protein TadG